MSIIFSNPWGFLALLGIPVVLAIHFLQQESRTVRVSTLFMLEALAPESMEGRRFQQLRNSVPLWLQLLGVLLLTWLIVQPRFLTAGSTQRITLVLDSAVSMRAFQGELPEKLAPRLREIAGAAEKTEWLLMESDTTKPVLYTGPLLTAMLSSLDKWKPSLGRHDPAPALRLALSSPTRKGMVIYVTDQNTATPVGVEIFAIGRPIPNGGFTGLRIDGGDSASPTWQVLVKNFSTQPMKRECTISSPNIAPTVQVVELGPGEAKAVKGIFPPGVNSVELKMNPDEFTFDDSFYIVRPKLKALTISIQAGATADFFKRFADSFLASSIIARSEGPDLQLGIVPDASFLKPAAPAPAPAGAPGAPGTPPPPAPAAAPAPAPASGATPAAPATPPPSPVQGAGVYMITSKANDDELPIPKGPMLVERSPLTQDLDFNGLIARRSVPVVLRAEDQALVWIGDRPIIFRRLENGKPQLFLNFDVTANEQTAALVVLLSRFGESLRQAKIAQQSMNYDTSQRIYVASRPTDGKVIVTSSDGSAPQEFTSTGERTALRAPTEPGLFTAKQGSNVLIEGAASFSDARELDFSSAVTLDGLKGKTAELLKQNTFEDAYQPLWLCMLTGVLLANWAWLGRRRTL